jgi:hypothetical protein
MDPHPGAQKHTSGSFVALLHSGPNHLQLIRVHLL